MKLFEFEAKNILKSYGIRVPESGIATNPEEAEAIARQIGSPVVLKSQILVSGRGKAGGIKFAADATEARQVASELLGSTIKGCRVTSLLVEEQLDVTLQFYASVTIDRQAKTYIVLASTSGGVDIEELAQSSPNKIARHWIDPTTGFSQENAQTLLSRFSLNNNDKASFATIISTLYQIALDYDAEMVEVNPLAKTPSGEFAADARIIIDDNALFRHPKFKKRESGSAEDTPREAEAKGHNLTYVDLDGDIGIIGNGAGLTMATLDLVNILGGKPANFLDIGGGAQVKIIKEAVMLVMSKPEVRAVLVNILGGITRCDLVAQGVVEGLDETVMKKPVAVRMIGTNEIEGAQILHQAGVHTYSNMEEAVREVLKL